MGNLRSKPGRAPLAAGWAAVCFLLLFGSFTAARGQAISDPNQIVGIIEWNNPPGPVKTFLNTPVNGMGGGSLSASQFGGVGFSASTLVADDPSFLSAPYTITVQSGVSPGIQYDVTPQMALLNGHSYYFATAASLGVEPEPAADGLLNFSECAGLVEVQFCDKDGIPVTVPGGTIFADISNVRQAQGGFSGVSSTRVAVRGGNTFNVFVSISMTTGTDPFVDLFSVTYSTNYTVFVPCDEIVPLKFIVPPNPVGSGGGAGTLGKIIGIADVLGKEEHWLSPDRTIVNGFDGPLGNFRYDNIEPLSQPGYLPCSVASPQVGTLACNSAGPFSLINLLPSNFSTPSQNYTVAAAFNFDLNRRFELFVTPYLYDVNVPPGATVDLGNAFVINPGYVVGDIFLCGPDEGNDANSCLRHIVRASDADSDHDGIPDDTDLNGLSFSTSSGLRASGLNVLGAGATHTANGGQARVLFEGDFVDSGPNKNHFVGDYKMTLGGLFGETTHWDKRELLLVFANVATPQDPDSYINSAVGMDNLHFADVEVVPTQTVKNDHRYGLSEVIVAFHSTSGTLFGPRVDASGSFNGNNFEGQSAQYTAATTGFGTPLDLASAATDGQVVLVLPEGTYTLNPTVYAVNPNGTSYTLNTLLPFTITVAPCERFVLNPELVLNTDPIPECVGQAQLNVSGSVTSTADVASIRYTLNGHTATYCTGCGNSPTFNFNLTLAGCDNTLEITATDIDGRVSSRSKTLHFEAAAPVLAGCENRIINIQPGEAGATVNFAVTASSLCDGALTATCNPPSGSVFNVGQTTVNCQAVDKCGHVGTCSFVVTVRVSGFVEHCTLTQGFYGNNGKFNGTPALTLITQLLTPNPLVVGKLGVRSLTIPALDAPTLQSRLPAGKTAAVLPKVGDKALATVGVPLTKNRFDNVLLGQTLTLSLNVRLDPGLLNLVLPANLCTQGTLPGLDGLRGTSDDTLVAGNFQSLAIPASVLAALSNASLGIVNGKVSGLLELANRGLAGLPTGGATLAEINAAVDAINRGFDECRVLVDCTTRLPVSP